MKKTGLPKFLAPVLLTICLLGLAMNIPVVESATGSVPVLIEVFEEITLSETVPLNFGKIVRPNAGVQLFTITPGGGLLPGPGSGSFINGQQVGQASLTGKDGELFLITVQPLGTGACNGFPAGTVNVTEVTVTPGNGTLDAVLNIGGTLQVSSSAEGIGTCTFFLSAEYQ